MQDLTPLGRVDLFSLAAGFILDLAVVVVAGVTTSLLGKTNNPRVDVVLTLGTIGVIHDLWIRIFLLLLPKLAKSSWRLKKACWPLWRSCINGIRRRTTERSDSMSTIGSAPSLDEDIGDGRLQYHTPPLWTAYPNAGFAILWVVMLGLLTPLCAPSSRDSTPGHLIALYLTLVCLSGLNMACSALRAGICLLIAIEKGEQSAATSPPTPPHSPGPLQQTALTAVVPYQSDEGQGFEIKNGPRPLDLSDAHVVGQFDDLSKLIETLVNGNYEHKTYMRGYVAQTVFERILKSGNDASFAFGYSEAIDTALGKVERQFETAGDSQLALEFRRELMKLARKHNKVDAWAERESKARGSDLWEQTWNRMTDNGSEMPSHIYRPGIDNSLAQRFSRQAESMFRCAYGLAITLGESERHYRWLQNWNRDLNGLSGDSLNVVARGNDNFDLDDVRTPDDICVLFGAVTRDDFRRKESIVLRPFDLWLAPSQPPARLIPDNDPQSPMVETSSKENQPAVHQV